MHWQWVKQKFPKNHGRKNIYSVVLEDREPQNGSFCDSIFEQRRFLFLSEVFFTGYLRCSPFQFNRAKRWAHWTKNLNSPPQTGKQIDRRIGILIRLFGQLVLFGGFFLYSAIESLSRFCPEDKKPNLASGCTVGLTLIFAALSSLLV